MSKRCLVTSSASDASKVEHVQYVKEYLETVKCNMSGNPVTGSPFGC